MAECLNPFYHRELSQHLPCGRCYNCLMRRSSGWSFRLMNCERYSMSAYFVTLTYDVDNVPLSGRKYMTLCKSDVQKFMKRLRFAQFGSKKGDIKYYLCGEYGGLSYRPHYHIVLFNADVSLLIGKRDAKFVELNQLVLDGKIPYYCPSWEYGHITVGRVSDASVGYTLKYMNKPKRIPLHHNDDRVKEFSCMSKGLGLDYLSKSMVKWHKADLLNRMYCNVDCKKIAMPRYYKDKIYTEQERQEILIEYLKEDRQTPKLSRIDQLRYSDLKLKKSSTENRKL